MPVAFRPRLDILPEPQQRLWPELADTPPRFTLYGGTAIALRQGHRPSVDFDFFAWDPFEPRELMNEMSCLRGAALRQSAANTLTVTIDRGGPVQLSFVGGLGLGQVACRYSPLSDLVRPRHETASSDPRSHRPRASHHLVRAA